MEGGAYVVRKFKQNVSQYLIRNWFDGNTPHVPVAQYVSASILVLSVTITLPEKPNALQSR